MSRSEIAGFLDVPLDKVDALWRDNSLQRTIYSEGRLIPELQHSSIYDVLELALTSGALPVCLSREHAALWVLYLCETVEREDWHSWPLPRQATYLCAVAAADGLIDRGAGEHLHVARTIFETHAKLVEICRRNDARLAYAS